jgi:nicotinic acetylcholine receptor
LDQIPGSNLVPVGIDLSEYYLSVEWDVLEVPATRNEEYYPGYDEPFSDITFKLTMRRKTLFYTINLIIPCIGITFLTVLVFYLPSDSGEKVNDDELNHATISNDPQLLLRLHFASPFSCR